jgi:Protein of unknown function (DUF2750)
MNRTWELNDREFASVVSLPAVKRYLYFIKRVVDWGSVWSIRDDDGWALTKDDDGNTLIPVWPHSRFAAACAAADWQHMRPAPIQLEDWIERWLPGIERDKRLIAVFATAEGRGAVVTPGQVQRDLDAELAKY